MRITCNHCPRSCVLDEEQRGYCFVRQNQNGKIVCTTYGRCTGLNIDPVEKKPLMHFLPGSRTLSLGTVGCNLGCLFCQNWKMSHALDERFLTVLAKPDEIAELAVKQRCPSVACTYNEPIVWAEYVQDIANECHHRGIKTIAVTSGYISSESRETFFKNIDAANIDLKGFSDTFYEKYCHARLAPVLDTIEWCAKETNTWLELTNLVIPRANDSLEMIRKMCDWIATRLGTDVPIHFSAFFPRHKLVDRLPTSWEQLKKAYDIAKRAGIHHVYLGNVNAPQYESTWCPGCGQMVVGREGYRITQFSLKDGRCTYCGTQIAGRV